MNTYEYRPQKFSDIVDNEINNKLLLNIAKEGSPSTLVLSGAFGCGKTTSARVFARAVNCENLTNDICGVCESCKCNINSSPYYTELDSSITNRVENIRDLYEDLTWIPKNKKRVIVFDEFHLTSRAAQSALLKMFEDAPENIYYVLCTTDKNAILPAIISRSLTLEFNVKSKETVVDNIFKIAKEQNIVVSEQVARLIALRSKGHMRDAHKLFEKYLIIGERDFLNLEESAYTYLAKYFAHVLWLIKNQRATREELQKHKSSMMELVKQIMNVPIKSVKDDYQTLFLDLAKKCFNPDYNVEQIVEYIVKQFDTRSIMNLYKVALDEFSMNSFEDDIRFQTALFSIYQRLLMGI